MSHRMSKQAVTINSLTLSNLLFIEVHRFLVKTALCRNSVPFYLKPLLACLGNRILQWGVIEVVGGSNDGTGGLPSVTTTWQTVLLPIGGMIIVTPAMLKSTVTTQSLVIIPMKAFAGNKVSFAILLPLFYSVWLYGQAPAFHDVNILKLNLLTEHFHKLTI